MLQAWLHLIHNKDLFQARGPQISEVTTMIRWVPPTKQSSGVLGEFIGRLGKIITKLNYCIGIDINILQFIKCRQIYGMANPITSGKWNSCGSDMPTRLSFIWENESKIAHQHTQLNRELLKLFKCRTHTLNFFQTSLSSSSSTSIWTHGIYIPIQSSTLQRGFFIQRLVPTVHLDNFLSTENVTFFILSQRILSKVSLLAQSLTETNCNYQAFFGLTKTKDNEKGKS